MRGRVSVIALAIAAAAGGGCIALALLVQHGRFAHFEQHSVSHWMPWIEPPVRRSTIDHILGVETRKTTGGTLVSLFTYPASIGVSAAIVLLCSVLLWRRGRERAGIGLLLLWISANAVALIGKHEVTRPRLHQTSFGHHGYLPGLSHSFPSGHALRAVVTAAALASLSKFGRLAYVWAAGVPFALVAIGAHTPTDVLGGVLAGIALSAIWVAAQA